VVAQRKRGGLARPHRVAGCVPSFILSTSQAETDIVASYQLHANAYITKPVILDLFTEAIRQVGDFFLTLVKLPQLRTKGESRGSARVPGVVLLEGARMWRMRWRGAGCPRWRRGSRC
jgi:hypothetical protein